MNTQTTSHTKARISSIIINALKLGAIGFYLSALLSLFFAPFSDYKAVLTTITGVLFIAHTLEYWLVRNKLKRVAGSTNLKHFINTLFFGVIYILPILRANKPNAIKTAP